MARFARLRASRWIGVAGLRDVAPRTPPGDFFAGARWTIFAGIKKSPGGVLATAGCLFACSFSSSQNANLTVEAPKLLFFSAKHQPRSRSAQVPPA